MFSGEFAWDSTEVDYSWHKLSNCNPWTLKIHSPKGMHFMLLIVKMFDLWHFISKYLSTSIYHVKFQLLRSLPPQLTSEKVEQIMLPIGFI